MSILSDSRLVLDDTSIIYILAKSLIILLSRNRSTTFGVAA